MPRSLALEPFLRRGQRERPPLRRAIPGLTIGLGPRSVLGARQPEGPEASDSFHGTCRIQRKNARNPGSGKRRARSERKGGQPGSECERISAGYRRGFFGMDAVRKRTRAMARMPAMR